MTIYRGKLDPRKARRLGAVHITRKIVEGVLAKTEISYASAISSGSGYSEESDETGGVLAHNLLDSTTHSDTLTGSPVSGLFVQSNGTPLWSVSAWTLPLTAPNEGKFLRDDGTWVAILTSPWKVTSNIIEVVTAGDCARLNNNETFTFRSTADQAKALFKLVADTTNRFQLYSSGIMEWGAGGVAAVDVNLYRSQANELKTDDQFYTVLALRTDVGVYLHQTGAPTGLNDTTLVYAGTDGRVYGRDGTNTTTHDLTIAHKQVWQIAAQFNATYNDISGVSVPTVLVNCVDEIANGATLNPLLTIIQQASFDFTNHYVTEDYTKIPWATVYAHAMWEQAHNTAFFMSFRKYGKTATLTVRMKRSAYTNNPLSYCYIGICEENSDAEVKQACTLTTDWTEFTVTADVSGMGSRLQWFIEFLAVASGTRVNEPSFMLYVDDIEVTQRAG